MATLCQIAKREVSGWLVQHVVNFSTITFSKLLKTLVSVQTCRVWVFWQSHVYSVHLPHKDELTTVWLQSSKESKQRHSPKKKTLRHCQNKGLALRPLSSFFIPNRDPRDLYFCPNKILQNNGVFLERADNTLPRFFPAALGSRWLAACWSFSLNPSTSSLRCVFISYKGDLQAISPQYIKYSFQGQPRTCVPPSSSHFSERIAPIRSEGPSFVRQGAQIEPNMFLVATRYADPAVRAQEEQLIASDWRSAREKTMCAIL